MKSFSLLSFGFVGLVGSILAGCPIFPDGGGNGTTYPCYGEGCACQQPSDCSPGETCGSDQTCHNADCTIAGCPANYTCANTVEGSSCVPVGGTGGSGNGGSTASSGSSTASGRSSGATGGSTSASSSSSTSVTSTSGSGGMTASGSTSGAGGGLSGSSSSSGGPAPVYCGHPADCDETSICGANGTCQPGPCSATNECILGYACAGDGTCQSETANSCDVDSNCVSGSACVAGSAGGGICTVAANECFDQSQCDAGENCESGKCIPSCVSNADCRDGFACNTVTGVCSVVLQPCTITNDCGSATLVCVAGACVPRSQGGACSAGDVWDENGCVPNQAATFTCAVDGSQGSCAAGSICLHHDCWISCDSPNQTACAQQTTLNQCKPVSDNGNTYNVCGSSQNLGSQCGAGTAGNQACTGGDVCIDGYCK